ncbi:MAG: GGDEF domain-containing protein [Desulfarculus sp.]|nr:MAG: GGDEF domain-containing protein [Desulfarculus sp.]
MIKIKHLGFKAAVAILFGVLLLTYGVYWRAISALHGNIEQLVDITKHLQQGETFHSAIHAMLMEAEVFVASGGPAHQLRFRRDLARAKDSLALLLEYARQPVGGQGHGVQALTQGMAREFNKYRAELEPVFSGDCQDSAQRLRTAAEQFNHIFMAYYLRLHEHHRATRSDLQQNTNNTWRAMATFFAVQLGLAIIAGLLVIFYLDRVVLKVFSFTERMAYRDRLTGLRNRAALDKLVEIEELAGQRERRRYALIMLDIDHFKAFNDTHGHQAGDKLLADFAALLVDNVRGSDRVVRYGGEEFLVHLAETRADEAGVVAEKLRRALEQARFLLPDGSPAPQVTASLGVAAYPADGRGFPEVVKKADQRLYAAKQAGRNRVQGPEEA